MHEHETLAVLEALMKWEDKLLGRKFTVVTDHKGLEHFKTQLNLSLRQTRWWEYLSCFNNNTKYGDPDITPLSMLDVPTSTVSSSSRNIPSLSSSYDTMTGSMKGLLRHCQEGRGSSGLKHGSDCCRQIQQGRSIQTNHPDAG